jgi:hypothetical protein
MMSTTTQKVRPQFQPGKGRKPVKITAEVMGKCLSQDLIWLLVRELREFNVEGLVGASARVLGGRGASLKRRTVQGYVQRLTLAGYLEKTVIKTKGCRQECSWKLVRDIGVDAPHLTHDGLPSRLGIIREQIWRTIKVIGDFDCIELSAVASTESVQVTPNTVRPYIKMLHKAGYLVLVRASGPRKTARYRKVPGRCQGKPPLVLNTKEVFDRNLMKVMEPVNH